MPYYISEYEGDGVDVWLGGTPFRPYTGIIPRTGWRHIDLRPDFGATKGGGGLNACLLWMPDDVSDPKLLKFAEDKGEIISSSGKSSLESRLNLKVNFFELNTAEDLVSELILKPPPKSWNAFKPNSKRKIEINLGPIQTKLPQSSEKLQQILNKAPMFIGFLATAFGGVDFMMAALFTEDFDGADQSPMTGQDLNWTQFNTAGRIDTVSNECVTGSDGQAYARADHDLSSDDHYAQIVLTDVTVATTASGVITRKSGANTTTTLYRIRCNTGNPIRMLIEKKIADSTTDSGLVGSTNIVDGDLLKGQSDGSNHEGFLNGSSDIGPWSDSGVTGNVRTGIFGLRVAASDTLDDFETADLAAGRKRTTKIF